MRTLSSRPPPQGVEVVHALNEPTSSEPEDAVLSQPSSTAPATTACTSNSHLSPSRAVERADSSPGPAAPIESDDIRRLFLPPALCPCYTHAPSNFDLQAVPSSCGCWRAVQQDSSTAPPSPPRTIANFKRNKDSSDSKAIKLTPEQAAAIQRKRRLAEEKLLEKRRRLSGGFSQ